MSYSFVTPRTFFGLEYEFDSELAARVPDFVGEATGERVTVSRGAATDADDSAWHLRYRDHEFAVEEHPAGAWLRIRYQDGPVFDLKRDGSEVRAWPMIASLDEIANCVLGPISGVLLYLRGTTCLHASAIVHQDRVLVFVGAAEAGKSTLAAAFATAGHRVLTDDVLALEPRGGRLYGQPAIPRIGLWPDSVKQLWGNADALPRQSATWDKRQFDLVSRGLFQSTSLPIGTVYVLADRKANSAFQIDSLEGADAVLVLIGNKYVTRYSERAQDRRDFILLSELAASVPVRRITRSDALSDLNATCEAIIADFDALALTAA